MKTLYFPEAKPRSGQAGAALLALMLILVTGAAYMLLSGLNDNISTISRRTETARVLNEAKMALMTYSINYPENHASGGPGILPCPDINNDGSAVGNCSFASGNTLGRFPWKTVGTGEYRDHDSEHLWYVVSDNFRTPVTGMINSDTPGTLNVDGISDIVAVIFAPGGLVGSQDRLSSPLLASSYLEGGNQTNDNNYYTTGSGEFNDQLVFITRTELMDMVETRVLGDVERAMSEYQTASWNISGVFPWLSPFTDPATSAFRGEVTTGTRGHVPFHWSGDTSGVAGRNPFTTDYTISWDSITNADVTQTAGTWFPLAPTLGCSLNSECNNGSDLFDGIVPSIESIAAASCTWSDKDTFDCDTATYTYTQSSYQQVWNQAEIYGYKSTGGTDWIQFYTYTSGSGKWDWGYFSTSQGSGWGTYTVQRVARYTLEREYIVDIQFTDPDGITVSPNTGTEIRTRELNISGDLSSADINLTITDTVLSIDYQYPDYGTGSKQSSTVVIGDTDTVGNIAVTGVHYDIDIDDAELPEWFVENGWHELVYVAYAPGSGAPPGASDCVSGSTCLTLNGFGGTINNKNAIVMIAGSELSSAGQDRTASPTLADYFEYENNNGDDLFEKGVITDFNDKIRILAEAP